MITPPFVSVLVTLAGLAWLFGAWVLVIGGVVLFLLCAGSEL